MSVEEGQALLASTAKPVPKSFRRPHQPLNNWNVSNRGRVRGDRLSTLSPNLFRVLLTAIEFKCTHREWYKLVHASVLNR